MKRLIFALIALMAITFTTQAQKFAYVDSDYILQNIPEYNDAQAQLDELSAQFQQEVEAKFSAIDKLYKDYHA